MERYDSEAARSGRSSGIKSPADGEMIPMEEIPDPAFSAGLMGTCIGILPSNGTIYAPLTGVVSAVAKTQHAISFKNATDEILVHVGLNTVHLNGESFRVFVKEGDPVRQGQPVMEANLECIRAKGFDPIVIVVRIKA